MDPHSRPAPIEPEGLLDGLNWRAIFLGALLDIVISAVVVTALLLWFVGSDVVSDEAFAEQAVERTLNSLEYLLAELFVGLGATTYGAFWAAKRAGNRHLRHGGWVAVVSTGLALLLLLIPGAQEVRFPWWYDVLAWGLVLPAGLLGGFLASKLQRAG